MRILKFSARGFRNLQKCSFSPARGVNVLLGDNGQGKTNILEALYLFTGARSFRAAKEADFVAFDGEEAELEVAFFSQEREQNAVLRFFRGEKEKKAIWVNGVPERSVSALTGRLCMVVFSPENLSAVKDGPEERRRLMDTAVTQLIPSFSEVSARYQRALAQRNALLKDLARMPSLADMLDVWDERLVRFGAKIIQCRLRYLTRIAPYAQMHYEGLSGGREPLRLRYASGVALGEAPHYDEIADAFRAALAASRERDRETRSTGVGPHRDDLEISLAGRAARFFGSQGQQRSAVLALKLAEAELLRETYGEAPVLLLDDVLSELDHSRQAYIVRLVKQSQVFLTCCERHESLGGRIYTIDGGRLHRLQKKKPAAGPADGGSMPR